MVKDRNSYTSIMKATSLFGGVKIFQIIITIIKTKFIAVLLGPTGMGISGLITSSTDMIGSLVGFGLETSAVRDVSQAYSSGDETRKNLIITVLKKLILLTGIIGTIVTFFLSSYLSKIAFGNTEYSYAFKIVSIILFFNQLNIGNTVLLQGTFHYKEMAKSALLGNLLSLIIVIPLYYIWGVKAIVPAIIVSSFILLTITWFYSRRINIQKINLSIKSLFVNGKVMLTLGAVIAATGFVTTGKAYLLRIFISNFGEIADVGLFTAGIAIANSYVGLVLHAMAKDYAPRLAAIANNTDQFIEVINKQAIFLITVLSPLIIFFIVFIKEVIYILYSPDFYQIIGMIEWVMFGMLFRAISWSISFSFIARGDSKIFFWNELFTALYSFGLEALLYYLWGLNGIGIGFMLTYVIYTIHMYIVGKYKYKLSFNKDLRKILLPQIFLCSFCFVVLKVVGYNAYRFIIGIALIGLSTYVSYIFIDKIINIKIIINNIKKRIFKEK